METAGPIPREAPNNARASRPSEVSRHQRPPIGVALRRHRKMPQSLRSPTKRKRGWLQAPSGTNTPSVKPPVCRSRLWFPTCMRVRMEGLFLECRHTARCRTAVLSPTCRTVRCRIGVSQQNRKVQWSSRQAPHAAREDTQTQAGSGPSRVKTAPTSLADFSGSRYDTFATNCRLYPNTSARRAMVPTE